MKDKKYIITALLAFHGLFINLSPGNFIGQFMQALCMVLLIIYLSRYRVQMVSKSLTRIIFLYSLGLIISTYLVRQGNIIPHESLASPYTPILLGLQLYGFYKLASWLRCENVYSFFRYFYIITSIYIFVMDMMLFSEPRNDDPDKYFIFMNKFDLIYLHLFWVSSFLIKQSFGGGRVLKKEIIYIVLHFSICMLVSFWAATATGFVGTVMLAILVFFSPKIIAFLYNKPLRFLLLLFFLDFGFFSLYLLLMDTKLMSYLIVELLGKDLSLTGRIYIYESLVDVLTSNPIWGYGPRNATMAMAELTRMPNAQNGLAQLFLDTGLVGIFFFSLIVYHVINDSYNTASSKYLIYFIFILVILSVIEITIDNKFICYVLLLLSFSNVSTKINSSQHILHSNKNR